MSVRQYEEPIEETTGRATERVEWPIVAKKDHRALSVFQPEALLREARRQKNLPLQSVPPICLLDPDGDIARRIKANGAGHPHKGWACYHTELLTFYLDGVGEVGIIGCAVGAPFAVLVAEQLFASGCELLVSVTSAGQITECGPTPYFVLIDRALRDEGTSYHYLPSDSFAPAPDTELIASVQDATSALVGVVVHRGATWTTDAPYRETEVAIVAARSQNILAVEMEAAALYAFAAAKQRSVVCFAHVTNSMAQTEGDFEKGDANGATATLAIIAATVKAWATGGRSES
jgi:uridine phosphorylase